MRAAVGGAIQPSVGAIAPELAGDAGVHHVPVLRAHDDACNAFAVREPDVGPVLAAVGRFIDAVADRHAVARPTLAGADPNRVGVRRIQRDRADRLNRFLVEDGLERGAAVGRLPDSAGGGADEQRDLAVLFVTPGDGRDAARHRCRADIAGAQARHRAGIDGSRTGWSERGSEDAQRRKKRACDYGGGAHFAPGAAGMLNIRSESGTFT